MRAALAVLGMAAAAGPWTTGAWAGDRPMLIVGAGEVTGYYYPTAGALCRVLNKERPGGKACAVSPSSGSGANVAALRAGEVDLAILQSRAAHLAVTGGEGFKDSGAFSELRALMSLHGETVLVLARANSGIATLADLKGKRVNMGRPGSFQRSMAEFVIEAAGLSEGDMAPVVELDLAEQAPALCEGNIDVAFFTGIHPMAEATAAVDECNATLVPVIAKALESNLKKTHWLSRASVKAGTYGDGKDDTPSLALKAVLAATTRLSDDDAYAVLKGVHANFGALVRLHPVFDGMVKAATARDGIAIRLHPGAERFYSEANLR